MAKYRKFTYTTGYCGTEKSAIFKFSDSYTEKEIEGIYDEWYEDQRSDSGDIEEISEEDALDGYIDDEYE